MRPPRNKKKKIKIAVPKGRVLNEALGLLRNAGYIKHPDVDYDSRKLIFDYAEDGISLLIVKPSDVPTFVEYGAADAGISGKDVLLEKPKNVYEPLDLEIGKCRIVVAAGKDFIKSTFDFHSSCGKSHPDSGKVVLPMYYGKANLRVATKYVRITRDFFNKKGVSNMQIIKLYGNVELAPISGLCDLIVDLVSTGETLRQNDLSPIEDIISVTSRLIVNRASLKINPEEISSLIEKLRGQIGKNAHN